MVFLTLILASLVIFIIWSIWERKQKMQWLQANGIPCDEPSLLLGNLAAFREKGMHGQFAEWTQKYGKLFGYYEGPRPVVVVADVDMIKQIMVKDFSCFQARKLFPTMDAEEKSAHMFATFGARWKRQRSLVSPSFSALRMKEVTDHVHMRSTSGPDHPWTDATADALWTKKNIYQNIWTKKNIMSPLINETVDHLLEVANVKAKEGKPFDIQGGALCTDCYIQRSPMFRMFQRLTLDTIACCAFGVEVNCLQNENAEFLKKCRAIFDTLENMSGMIKAMFLTGFMFPDFFALVRPLERKMVGTYKKFFTDVARNIIEERKRENTGRTDFIQLMLNAEETDVSDSDLSMKLDDPEETGRDGNSDKVTKETKDEIKTTRTGKDKRKKTMTLEEMLGQCFLFLLAGYESTSTALSYLAYELALNPDVQEKLQAEIDQHFPDQVVCPEYSSVANMPYFDMVLNEVLRLHPIGPIGTVRMCTQPCNVGGVPFRKGDYIQINMAAVHQDAQLWGPEDPTKFVPERFLPERVQMRHPMAWIPFGGGPRNCVGMHFAILEIKVTLVRFLKTFILKSCNETEVPLSKGKNGIIAPLKGVWVELVPRN